MARALRFAPLLLANLLAVLLLPFPGTVDVGQFLRWTVKILNWGPIVGYRTGNNPYPPISPMLLAVAGHWAQLTGTEPRAALKLLLLLFLLLSTGIVWAWTRSALFAGLFQLALVLNCAALGYLDVLFLPPLLLTLWALQRERIALASLLFGLTVMTKFQPAVLTPLLLLHALGPGRPPGRPRRPLAATLPALAVFLVTLAIFGLPLLDKLRRVTLDWYLCGNAFNLNWIATWLIRVFVPDWAGGLDASGLCRMISQIDPLYMWPSKLVFLGAFAAILAGYWRRPKTFENFLIWSTLAFVAAWMLSAGMHENHLYVGQVLALLLGVFDRRFLGTALIWSIVGNLNLLLTVGIAGGEINDIRVVGGLDLGLVMSLLNLLAFAVLIRKARRA